MVVLRPFCSRQKNGCTIADDDGRFFLLAWYVTDFWVVLLYCIFLERLRYSANGAAQTPNTITECECGIQCNQLNGAQNAGNSQNKRPDLPVVLIIDTFFAFRPKIRNCYCPPSLTRHPHHATGRFVHLPEDLRQDYAFHIRFTSCDYWSLSPSTMVPCPCLTSERSHEIGRVGP